MAEFRIAPARSAEDFRSITALFREYEATVPCVSGMEADLADLPGRYGPPWGLLLLASLDGVPAGCVAYRTIGPGLCEMKRLYVRHGSRGLGIGRELVARAVGDAAGRGFRRMFLDTAPYLAEALGLYRSAGFREVPPYWDCPVPDAIYLGLDLDPDCHQDIAIEGRTLNHGS